VKIEEKLEKYASLMEEIKKRYSAALHVLQKKVTTGYLQTDVEFVSLQLRKILELIALSSLVANKEEYALIRDKFATDWNSVGIIKLVKKINPDYYPQPVRQMIDEATKKVTSLYRVEDGYLTEDDFLLAFNYTSDLLHAKNPFSGATTDSVNHFQQMSEYLGKVVKLLNCHTIQLPKQDEQIWVVMSADGKVQTSLFKKV